VLEGLAKVLRREPAQGVDRERYSLHQLGKTGPTQWCRLGMAGRWPQRRQQGIVEAAGGCALQLLVVVAGGPYKIGVTSRAPCKAGKYAAS
jgi:hypothetical protein